MDMTTQSRTKNHVRWEDSFRIQILQNRLHNIDVHRIRVHDGFGYDANGMESKFNSYIVVV